MNDLDKRAMGRRIRQIRVSAGLKQWELASRLGTTQSAVHKYERGVVPEPRRLVEIARIGGTTIEWILTGHHWEDGSESRERLPAAVLDIACRIHAMATRDRDAVEEALRIVRDALAGLADAAIGGTPATAATAGARADALQVHGHVTLRLIETAWRIQRSVLEGMAADALTRLGPASDDLARPSDAPSD